MRASSDAPTSPRFSNRHWKKKRKQTRNLPSSPTPSTNRRARPRKTGTSDSMQNQAPGVAPGLGYLGCRGIPSARAAAEPYPASDFSVKDHSHTHLWYKSARVLRSSLTPLRLPLVCCSWLVARPGATAALIRGIYFGLPNHHSHHQLSAGAPACLRPVSKGESMRRTFPQIFALLVLALTFTSGGWTQNSAVTKLAASASKESQACI